MVIKRLAIFVLGVAMALATGCHRQESAPGKEASLLELNRALQMWKMARADFPAEVCDLTNLPALGGKQLPKLPKGKKLVFENGEVVIGDE